VTVQHLPMGAVPATDGAATAAETPMLRAEGLVKTYGRTRALNGLSLHVPRGSIYGFVGPNGAGKTTTLRILATLLTPEGGEAWVDGRLLTTDPAAVRSKIGFMPDFFGVYDNLTVSEYLDFYAAAYGVPAAESRRTNAELLELVDLAPKRDDFVENLSRGMKQRLGLARCLVHNPQVLLLDEPASGMDPRARYEMREIVKELQRMGKTVLVSSHILLELAEMCSHIGIIQDGRLLREGPVHAILGSLKGARSVRIGVMGEVVPATEVAARAVAVLGGQPGVSDIVPTEDGLEVTFAGDDAATAALLRALVEAGIPVLHFARATSSLEEIFMQLTENDDQG
jgi:ABC-2 type transport system ATP-binding protein